MLNKQIALVAHYFFLSFFIFLLTKYLVFNIFCMYFLPNPCTKFTWRSICLFLKVFSHLLSCFITFIFKSFVTSQPMCWWMYLVMKEVYIYIIMNRVKNKKLNNSETTPKTNWKILNNFLIKQPQYLPC